MSSSVYLQQETGQSEKKEGVPSGWPSAKTATQVSEPVGR